MPPFLLFAVLLVTGTVLQAAGLLLCALARQRARSFRNRAISAGLSETRRTRGNISKLAGRSCWLLGAGLLLCAAFNDHDALLFTGQVLAGMALWHTGLLDGA